MDAISATRAGIVNGVSGFGGASTDLANTFSGRRKADDAIAPIDQAKANNAFRAATVNTSRRTHKALLDITV